MFVGDYMTTSPITIRKQTPVTEALAIIKKHKIRQLPVVSQNKLVGLITERILLAVSPSPATTLSVYEMKDLMSKLVVGDVMIKDPITVSPDCTIEEAALIMREHKVNCLLVQENGALVGIITQTDLFDALIKMFGFKKVGTRIVIEAEDRMGLIAQITGIVRDCNVNLIGIAVSEKTKDRVQVMLRLSTVEPEEVIKALKDAGFSVIRVN